MNWPEPIEKIVLYSGADFDALFATWLFIRHTSFAKFARFEFVKIGETWKNEPVDADPAVVHIDTGHGRFDHHAGKGKSATEIMIKELELEEELGLERLIDLVHSYEKAEKQVFYAPSQLITGWYYLFRTNPRAVLDRAFELFDILYGQEKQRSEVEAQSGQVVWQETGKRKIAVLEEIPQLRDWAYDNGADIAIWKNTTNQVSYYGIQVSRFSDATLEKVVAGLRQAEAEAKKIEISPEELEKQGELEILPGWYLHESGKLILCGSRKKPLKKHEVSLLTFPQIREILSNTI